MVVCKASLLSQFLKQDDIAEDVKHCNLDIDTFCDNFMIHTHMELHNWQNEFAENHRKDQQEIMQLLGDRGVGQEFMQESANCNDGQVQEMMRMMQNVMSRFEVGDRRHTDIATNLYEMQQTTQRLLPEYDLKAGEVRRIGGHPVGGSQRFGIWEGEYLGREKCAIKVLPGIELSSKTRDRFLQDLKVWRDVWEEDKGTYILPFYGVCHNDGPYPYIVSPWLHNGDALSYVKKYPDSVDRRFIVRHIAEGLRLLHTQPVPIAHCDIKAANILIDDHGRPLLADFGLSKFMPYSPTWNVTDSFRWLAPELCTAPGVPSTHSDIFSYAMTVLEIMTGEHPFAHIRRSPEVLIRMQHGERPQRPTDPVVAQRGLDDKLWNLLQRCWVEDPLQRPDIHAVLEELPPA